MTAGSPEMLQRDDAIVHEDRHITSRQLALSISINKGRVSHIIPDFGYSKVCAERVPRSPAVGQKTKTNFFRVFDTFEAEGEAF